MIEFCAVCLDTRLDMSFDKKIWLSNASVSPGLAYKFTIDLATNRCTRSQVDRASVEFPTTHPYRNGITGTRFNYLMACDRPGCNLPFRDVVKVRENSCTLLKTIREKLIEECMNNARVVSSISSGVVTKETCLLLEWRFLKRAGTVMLRSYNACDLSIDPSR